MNGEVPTSFGSPVDHTVHPVKKLQNNISLQTGEEFSMEFVNERIAPKVASAVSDSSHVRVKSSWHKNDENSQLQCEDFTGNLGFKKIDSQRASESEYFTSAKGSPSENMCKWKKDDGNGGGLPKNDSTESFSKSAHLGQVPSSPYKMETPTTANNYLASGASLGPQNDKLKFLCSFGGKILPRPSDGKLRYVGGETRIISIRKNISWEELTTKTLCICKQPHIIKYQLPGEDLDALVSVSSYEDLQNMVEECYGLERHEGSNRPRIFLIPLGESEKTPSFEDSSVQQSDPDYQYVVAVNGTVDPNPRKDIGGQILTTEAARLGTNVDRAPKFHKRSPSALSPLEVKGGYNAWNPADLFNMRSPTKSQPVSPVPLQQGTAYLPSHGNKLCQGNNEISTFSNVAKLPPSPSNSAISNANCEHPTVALQSKYLPFQGVEIVHQGLPSETRVRNGNVGKEFLLPSAVNQYGNGDLSCERPLQDGNVKSQEDLRGMLSGSNTMISSAHGMQHAFSDSMLHETGNWSVYGSQEGTNQLSSSNPNKAYLSPGAMPDIFQGCSKQHQNVDSVFPQNQIQSKLPDELVQQQGSQDLPYSSSYSDTFHNGGSVHRERTDSSEKYHTALSDISRSSFIPTQSGTNSMPAEIIKMVDENVSDGRSPRSCLHNMKESYAKEPFLEFTFDAKRNKLNEPSSRNTILASSSAPEFKPFGNMTDHSVNCDRDNGPFKVEDVNRTPTSETDYGLAKISRTTQQHGDQNSLEDLIFGFSDSPFPLESARLQPSTDRDNTDSIKKQAINTPSVKDNHVSSSKLPRKDLQNSQNSLDPPFPGETSILDIDFIPVDLQNAEKLSTKNCFSKNSNTRETILGQKETAPNKGGANQAEQFLIKQQRPIAYPSSFESMSNISQMVNDSENDILSPLATDLESNAPEFIPKESGTDEGDINKSLTDAMIAEMEASVYGLQIIRNADLEELRELGSGTYGTVYHGKWRGTDVAIKRIRKSCFAGRSSEQDRLTKDFWREAKILSNLHHPNVVAFYGVVPDGAGGTMATVTEYMVNGSLRNVLIKRDRSLDRRKKLIIAMDAAFGMEYLHSKNIVHFDLKCDNLLVNLRDPQRPICKVGDFGLSKIKHNTLVSGGVRGTLPWMAPELLNGSSSKVSDKVDVFSFGISMWEILTGEEPYADMHCGAIIGGIVSNTLRPHIPQRCDSEWRKLMEQCWSPDPEARPSFTDIANRLRSMYEALRAKESNNQVRHPKPTISS